ncbi:UDP-glucuronosyltransferase 2B15-like [Thrips palmi]|uniref:UDP-glucuronosyltransferase 2B15-like n=1 Tax=Thrips palmi TaxID=161013 RepID=A0A6P9ABC7_THRPL|nr:UDP-glucuronosyltransferase 2B15-like [Thrips palmi]
MYKSSLRNLDDRVACSNVTMARVALAVLLVAVAVAPPADALRILGIFPIQARSHNIMFKGTLHALVDSGHEVVDLSPYPLKTPRSNYTDVDLSKVLPSLVNTMNFEELTALTRVGLYDLIRQNVGAELCRKVFQTKQFQDIMSGAYGKFDVVFTEIVGTDCFSVVAHKMQVPLISIATQPDFSQIHERMGSVDNPSYLVTTYEALTGRMNLWQRCRNVFAYFSNIFLVKWWFEYPSDIVLREFFGEDTPPISELIKNTSLVMVNRHVSINPARPSNPNVIEVAGIHIREKPNVSNIPPAIRKWMDEAEHGVVYFSLGSLVRSDTLPKSSVRALLAAFAALPQRVLWKYEDSSLELPPNVRIAAWLPQSDVLAHPKVMVFMTHGGLMGTSEALSLGVPMIGIPVFADQGPNILQYEELGIARLLDHRDISKETVLAAIREFTTSNKYRERAREVAALYADRPRTAAQEVVWWTEYVVRHKGARHLRPLSADLPLHQYLLLDVIAVFLAAVVTVLAVVSTVLKKVLRIVSATQPPRSKAKTQ